MQRPTTDLEKSQDTLRQTEARLRSLLDSQTAYVLRTDMSGVIVYANTAWTKAFGWMPEACVGASSMASIMPIDHEKALETVRRCIEIPGTPIQVMLRKPTRTGGTMWSLGEFVAIADASGAPTEIQCMGFDVTQVHETEEALHQSEKRFSTTFRTSSCMS